ncbi:MAG: C-terminal binding protein [Planctomycetaceae bacterium]|nr:C-terminal binding protein [Planctomycetaceae bacterium]
MKIAITDYSFPSPDIEEGILRPLGHDIAAWKEKRTAAELPQLVADADAVITQFAPVTADVIASMRQAKVIVRYGIGVDNVDLEAAKVRGIPVCNVPDYCIDEVADQTLAFLLATTRQVVTNCVRNREGKWGLATSLDQMRALRDLSVGVVGFGRIGREVVSRLRAFKCQVLVHDPVVAAGEIEQAGCKPVALHELLSQSDVISLHCPSMAQTRGMINRDSLAITKRGVILINVARGDLVDSAALTEALQSGHISAAALDVFAPEPIPADHPILKMDNVIVASHIASCSVPAVKKLRETAANLAAMALRGDVLPNVVNGVGRLSGLAERWGQNDVEKNEYRFLIVLPQLFCKSLLG